MSSAQLQTLIAAIVSVVFVLSVHRLGRRSMLSFRYTVGWMMLGMMGVIAGLLLPLAEPVAVALNVSPAALLGGVGILLLMTLCVQLSISISGLQDQVRTLAEELGNAREESDRRSLGTKEE